MSDGYHKTRDSREKRRSAIEEQKTLYGADGPATSILMSREAEVEPMFKSKAEASAEEERVAVTVAHLSEGNQLVLLQVNCRSICNKILVFWNLIDTYNPDVVIGTESWLSEESNNA